MIRLKNLLNESIVADPAFVDYIVSVEGTGPGSSPETGHKAYKDSVGVWTIGYGHAATSDVEPKTKPGMKISDAEARQILMKDIASSVQKVKTYISTKFPNKSLDQHQLKMLTDFAFNPGLSKFPVFVKAVVYKDWKTAANEYKRYAGQKELTDRNTKFYNLFLSPLLKQKTLSPTKEISPTKGLTGVDWMDSAIKSGLYKVRPGDQLLPIANKFGLTLDLIKGMNGMTNDDIRVGQVLKVK
jgi:GH24 family phage-related lysozyme (muramidase)